MGAGYMRGLNVPSRDAKKLSRGPHCVTVSILSKHLCQDIIPNALSQEEGQGSCPLLEMHRMLLS
jgi:hypothetical protein